MTPAPERRRSRNSADYADHEVRRQQIGAAAHTRRAPSKGLPQCASTESAPSNPLGAARAELFGDLRVSDASLSNTLTRRAITRSDGLLPVGVFGSIPARVTSPYVLRVL